MSGCDTNSTVKSETGITEADLARLVQRFYELALADGELRPIFDSAIVDWDEHHRIVRDFWPRMLLGTSRYQGSPYASHERLPLRPEHFDRWLALFRQAVAEALPEQAARRAVARAEHMTESFRAGMFTFSGPMPPLRTRRA